MAKKPFYISKEDLVNLISHFEKNKAPQVGKKNLIGFAFRRGKDGSGSKKLFPDALYSDGPLGDPRMEVLVKNDSIALGCPYPPGYSITLYEV